MAPRPRRPTLGDLQYLRQQLQADKLLSTAHLRQRDHSIGQRCRTGKRLESVMYWLDHVEPGETTDTPFQVHEKHWAALLRLIALALGAAGLAGFMLASEKALVNVPLFLLLFVFLQGLMCVFAAWMTFSALRGDTTASAPFNPAKLIVKRVLPDAKDQHALGSISRLLLLRYGQELGAMFALGAVLAFVVLLAVTDFSFVWGSTFSVSDSAVRGITQALSAPWRFIVPEATVSPDIIAGSRFHPAQYDLGGMAAESRRGWWPFLLACLLFYTLLPRLLLWGLCLWGFHRQLRVCIEGWPGVSSVLARMRAPVVETRATEPEPGAVPDERFDGAILLDWAGALESLSAEVQAQLPTATAQRAGLGSPSEDVEAITAVNNASSDNLLVAVRGWEPPMADLADVLAEVTGVGECRLLLVRLPGRELSEAQLGDWQRFANSLPFNRTDVDILGGEVQ